MDYKSEKQRREALEMLEVSKTLEALEKIDLDQIRIDGMTDMEKMVEELKSSKTVVRKLKKKTAHVQPNKKLHWKTKRKRKRDYYRDVTRYRRLELRGELLSAGSEGWWKYLTTMWHRKKVEVTMTFEEWDKVIWPLLQGRVPVIHRYQTRKPIALDNVYITESDDHKNVLFDGKEHSLRQMGYML